MVERIVFEPLEPVPRESKSPRHIGAYSAARFRALIESLVRLEAAD
jgi:hypothetical protein